MKQKKVYLSDYSDFTDRRPLLNSSVLDVLGVRQYMPNYLENLR